MKIYKALILILFISPFFSNAQEFTKQDDQLIKQKVTDLIKRYELFATFKGGGNLLSENKQQQFRELFTSNNSMHYNDLSEKVKSGQLLTIDQYLFLLNSNYKNSLSVQLEPERVEYSHVRVSKKNYQVNVKASKKVVGFHNEGYIHSFEKELWLVIQFDKSLNTFKILAVDDKPSNPKIYQPKNDKGRALELYYNLSSVQLNHDLTEFTNDLNSSVESNICFGIIYRAPLVKRLNLLTGLQYTSVSSQYELPGYYYEYSSVDADDEEYTRIVNSGKITETQKNSFLNIQLGLQYRIPLSQSVKFNISLSGLYSLNIINEFESEGTFSYQGYYPQYNITLYDLPQYGFASDQELSASGEMDIGSNISILAGLGFEFRISEGANLQFEGYYQQGVKDISKNETVNYIISDSPADFNSLKNASSSTKVTGYGLKVGIVFIL